MAAPESCPNCGAAVPPLAKACPECGSCEKTGWSDAATCETLDLPDEDFDYEEFVKKEFGAKKALPRGISWFWWLVSLLVAGIILVMIFGR
jgi:hypothetical protein